MVCFVVTFSVVSGVEPHRMDHLRLVIQVVVVIHLVISFAVQ